MVLHTINRTGELLDSCLRCLSEGDVLLLIEDAVYAACLSHPQLEALKDGGAKLCVLAEDVAARGLASRLDDAADQVDYPGFVALAADCSNVRSWY